MALIGGAGGCSRPRPAEAGTDEVSEAETHRDPAFYQPVARPKVEPPVVDVESPAREENDFPTLIDPPDVRELEKKFWVETEVLTRVEAVFRIADVSSGEALETLTRLYHAEPDPEIRERIVDSFGMVETADLEPVLAVVRDAIGVDRPEEMRESAANVLMKIQHPEALEIWQALRADPNREMGELADRMVEFLGEMGTGPEAE